MYMGQTGKSRSWLSYPKNDHITLTLTKFIIPECMDTVVDLGLVESPGVGADGLIGGWLNGCFLTYRMNHDTDT